MAMKFVVGALTIPTNQTIYAGSGDDYISTAGGNDHIYAGNGNNVIEAGEGNNRIYAGFGYDYISAGAGDDRDRHAVRAPSSWIVYPARDRGRRGRSGR